MCYRFGWAVCRARERAIIGIRLDRFIALRSFAILLFNVHGLMQAQSSIRLDVMSSKNGHVIVHSQCILFEGSELWNQKRNAFKGTTQAFRLIGHLFFFRSIGFGRFATPLLWHPMHW